MSKFFAQLSGNIVVNTLIANSKEDAELVTNSVCVEFTDANPAAIGYIYNLETNNFDSPYEPAPRDAGPEISAPTEG
jgi:hypothetical protein